MTTSRENKSTQKPVKFSESEIEAAKVLLQLKNGYYSEHDHHKNNTMLQRKQHNKVDRDGASSSSITAAATAEAEADAFERENMDKNRYRHIKDIYVNKTTKKRVI
ncbi:hypothetical protein TanjilG_13138 [Lupinus angustifolius]|uniref:Uncharacterized protein n=1 Tax=Lupinus angustifolius TaxID=3871 RepID=A0A1J7GJY7_LUPAN|nr:hypothetical protein TanjilG_13138 [Lupinus angustifolius]